MARHGVTHVAAAPAACSGIAVMLAGLAVVGPFSINTYLPSFDEMEVALGTNRVALQQTVSIYFASFAFMALWHGAISDSFGRRRVVLTGLVVFAIVSLAAAFATHVEQLWVLRAFQGFSAGAGIVIGRAIIRDLHDGPLAQRLMSQVVLLYGLAPAVAPLIGGWLQVAFGWRSVFTFLALLGVGLLGAAYLRLPETLPINQRQPFNPPALAAGYLEVLCNRPFMMWCLSYAMMFGGFFIYVLSAPVFLMQHLHVGETAFLWMFGPATAGLMLGSVWAGRIATRWSARITLRCAFAIMAVANLYNTGICLAAPSGVGWYVVYMLVYNLGMSLAVPTMTVLGLNCVPSRRGMGSSVQLFVQTGFNAIIAAVLAPLVWGSRLSLAIAATSLCIAAGLGTLGATRHPR